MYRASLDRPLLLALLLIAVPAAAALAAPATPTATTTKPAKPTAPAAAAPAKDAKPSVAQRMRPNGPVTVTATSVDWAKNGLMVYTGDVKLSSDTLNLDGDRLELEQLGDGQYKAKVTGAPAHLQHMGGEPDAQGEADPPVTARGKTLIYDSKNGIADVIGDARVTRGEDEITGQTIHYNVNERRIQAVGGSGGQVRIVIQPNSKNVDAPAPKPPAAKTTQP